ncbi:glycosyltransferase family 4 protein [Rosistilla oblonga]|uniref:glycosyltransferase family 4 protein n=1 Tax=Rosistilla oblonga TaxID=2527990 RepID=UPI003A96A5B6
MRLRIGIANHRSAKSLNARCSNIYRDGNSTLIIGIDASRNRSGGARAHLQGILSGAEPQRFGIEHVHLWAYRSLADSIPNYTWLTKHTPAILEGAVTRQLLWQRFRLRREATEAGCELMFNTDAGSVCNFQPSVTMSQDMLSFEPGEMQRYRGTKAWLRLFVLRYVQAVSLKRSNTALFLTNHAASVIQHEVGAVKRQAIVPHGVDGAFRQASTVASWPINNERPIRFVYVSNTTYYKHQWNVVRAFGEVRKSMDSEATLLLIGGGSGKPQMMLEKALDETDPQRSCIQQMSYIEHASIPRYLAEADVFVFASSCENMPITLLEAMASGLPIACAKRGPMPEVLGDAGFYFDPENPSSIANALKELVSDSGLRNARAAQAKLLSEQFSWERCAKETWQCLTDALPQPEVQASGMRRAS